VARGKLITIEGIDGAGKSTLAQALARELATLGHPVELLREPGGVDVSERIRALVKDPALAVTPRAEALLYAAARAQLVQELLAPLLERGTLVLLDRFVDSSLA
jgi:dTMP kinase